jgi:hypothetical protein
MVCEVVLWLVIVVVAVAVVVSLLLTGVVASNKSQVLLDSKSATDVVLLLWLLLWLEPDAESPPFVVVGVKSVEKARRILCFHFFKVPKSSFALTLKALRTLSR